MSNPILDEMARELEDAAIAFEQHRSMNFQGRVYFDFGELASAALTAYANQRLREAAEHIDVQSKLGDPACEGALREARRRVLSMIEGEP